MIRHDASFPETTFRFTSPLRTLWHFLRPDSRSLALAVVFFTVKHSPVWIIPVLTASVISIIAKPQEHNFAEMGIYLGIITLLLLQNIPSTMLWTMFFSRTSRNTEARLRGALIRRLQQLSISYHGDAQSGRLQAKVLRDVENVERLNSLLMTTVYPSILGVTFALVMSLIRQPLMALFFLLAIPSAALLRHLYFARLTARNKAFRQNIEAMSGQVAEMIQMIPMARAHAAEEHEITRMDIAVRSVREHGYKLDLSNSWFGCSAWVTFGLFRTACLATTAYMAYVGIIPDVGDVIMYQFFFEIILGSVSGLLGTYPMMAGGFESLRSIGEILQCPDIEHNEGKQQLPSVAGHITFDHVTFQYRGAQKPAIEDLCLKVSAGESVAFVGESGAGKSTVMNLLIGFHRPTGGRIYLDGIDMQKLDLRSFRRHLAVVPQTCELFSGSIRDNIAFGLSTLRDEEVWQAIEMANAMEFVEKLPDKLDTTIGESGCKLSGGQRQRLAIARALVRNPRVIIFDEATSALDVISENLVQEAIAKMMQGRTTFIVAHRLSTIRKCDRIVVMRDGRCVETGSHAQLMEQKNEFYKLKSLQV